MNSLTCVFFILVGLFLFFIEMFILPGFGIVGLMALASQAAGVYGAFKLSQEAGIYSLLFCILANIVMIIIGAKQVVSGKWSINHKSDSKINTNEDLETLTLGDKGATVSILRPNGKAEFNQKRIEVYSLGEFIEQNEPIEIVKIEDGKIYVKKN